MFDFFVEQILGMQWLNDLVWYVLINYFHADQNSNWWSSAHFFFYDTIKITILLVTLIDIIYSVVFSTRKDKTNFNAF
jgi:hypothetical protein